MQNARITSSKFSLFARFLLLLGVIFFTSCKTKPGPEERIDFRDSFYWALCEKDSTYDDFLANRDKFVHLDELRGNNLSNLEQVGTQGKFIWITFDFTVPENLKNQDLSLVIPFLKFSDEVFLNGFFIGGYGTYEPETSPWFQSQDFWIAQNMIKEGTNTILIKVWVHGKCRISTETFIGPRIQSENYSKLVTFLHSRIYIFFVGGMFAAFLLYFFLFFRSRRRSPQHLSFAILNFFTILFMAAFYAPDFPFYTSHHMSNLTYMKISLCIGAYGVFYFISSFILNYFDHPTPPAVKTFNLVVVTFQILLTLGVTNYNTLMKICPLMLTLIFIEMGYSVFIFFKYLFTKPKRSQAITLIRGFAPVLIAIAIDIIIRLIWKERIFMYYSMIGWQLSIIYFLVLLTKEFYHLFYQVEVLNTDLEQQVLIKTHKLSQANIELENIIRKANEDLAMAAIVQKKFFPFPKRNFKGWDMYIYYKPLAEVSGDLYDYYSVNEKLNGISLFDVSGHGIASSLITMLAKDIINNLFDEATDKGESVSETLEKFNEALNVAKGDVDNYLTGLLFRFGQFDSKERCNIELSNAGHPYPILYDSKTKQTMQLKPYDLEKQYGSIGIKGLEVSFQQTEFTMQPEDILVCFTDGILEATNPQNEQFQSERIEKIIRDNANLTSKELIEVLVKELETFRNGKPLEDDITIIVLKRDNSLNYIEELYDTN